MSRWSWGAICGGGALLSALGCAPNNRDLLHFLQEHRHEVSAIEYRVGVPDTVGLSAPRVLEIDGEIQRVQPDGKINLRLLGEVKVAGMTAREIAAKLEVLLSPYYVDPKVSVRIVGYSSKKYYVFGQVAAVGPRAYSGRDTLVDAVMTAGINFMSWTSQVKVIRPSRDGEPAKTLVIDIDRMVKTGDWQENILLEADDVVYIPPTPLAWVGLRFQELLFPVTPAIDAYTTPARAMAAQEIYDDEDDGRNRASRLGITLR